jgi:hypothetical protein
LQPQQPPRVSTVVKRGAIVLALVAVVAAIAWRRARGHDDEATAAHVPRAAERSSLRAAMHEAKPILAECYTSARARNAVGTSLDVTAKMTLIGDKDVGTLIDAHAIESESPIPRELDECLRDTFQKLELPPVGGGGRVEVTYPLAFRDE